MVARLLPVLALAMAAVTAESSGLPEDWRHWKYSRAVAIEELGEFVRLTLPIEVYGHAQTKLADLRIINDAAWEVPYILRALRGHEERTWSPVELAGSRFVPGEYTEVTADVGADATRHNALEVQTGVDHFFAWVEVAVSDDREQWGIVRESAPLYRFEEADATERTVISYTESTHRWLRIRIFEQEYRFPVFGARVAYQLVEEPELVDLPSEDPVDPRFTRGATSWQVDLGVDGVPVSAVRFEAEQREFHRTIHIERSSDGETWRSAGRGDIYRYQAPGIADESDRASLRVRFSEARGRHWRVQILDRNDAPIEGIRMSLQGTPRHLFFQPEPGRAYRLIYGNHRVEEPEYDLGKLTPKEALEAVQTATLASEELNTDYVSPAPWSERHPVVLWAALALAVVVLAWLSIRALRS